MTMQRAMWQSFGLRLDEMTQEDYELKAVMLAAEAEHGRSKREEK